MEPNELPLNAEERHAALFAHLVMQLSSTALVMLGRAPNPVTGKTETDLETARMLIDQLEMLAAKTRGNLGADEKRLLQQGLMTLRMAFVEATTKPAAPAEAAPSTLPPAGEEEARKKFSKSYGQA
jgi:hypothetical protein